MNPLTTVLSSLLARGGKPGMAGALDRVGGIVGGMNDRHAAATAQPQGTTLAELIQRGEDARRGMGPLPAVQPPAPSNPNLAGLITQVQGMLTTPGAARNFLETNRLGPPAARQTPEWFSGGGVGTPAGSGGPVPGGVEGMSPGAPGGGLPPGAGTVTGGAIPPGPGAGYYAGDDSSYNARREFPFLPYDPYADWLNPQGGFSRFDFNDHIGAG